MDFSAAWTCTCLLLAAAAAAVLSPAPSRLAPLLNADGRRRYQYHAHHMSYAGVLGRPNTLKTLSLGGNFGPEKNI